MFSHGGDTLGFTLTDAIQEEEIDVDNRLEVDVANRALTFNRVDTLRRGGRSVQPFIAFFLEKVQK